ncbi:MAG: hypothetical protein FWE09_05700 [Treponema sp.]|nr:hypothetical protein [Treponema sp.]
MKTLDSRIKEINFRKAFVVFFVAFFACLAVFVAYMAISGNFSAIRAGAAQRRAALQEDGRLARHWGHGRSVLIVEADGAAREARIFHGREARPWGGPQGRRPGGRGMLGVGLFFVVGFIFRAVFRLLLAAWVYADSRKNGKNKILWPVVVLATSLAGIVIYLISREHTRLREIKESAR